MSKFLPTPLSTDTKQSRQQGIAAQVAGGTAYCLISCGYCGDAASGCESRVDGITGTGRRASTDSWKSKCCGPVIEAAARSCADFAPPCLARNGTDDSAELSQLKPQLAQIKAQLAQSKAQDARLEQTISALEKQIAALEGSRKTRTDSKPSKPNIVFFLTDDQAQMLGDAFPMTTGATPMPKAKAQLMDKGSMAENFFVHTPICCPSRAEMLSGVRFAPPPPPPPPLCTCDLLPAHPPAVCASARCPPARLPTPPCPPAALLPQHQNGPQAPPKCLAISQLHARQPFQDRERHVR